MLFIRFLFLSFLLVISSIAQTASIDNWVDGTTATGKASKAQFASQFSADNGQTYPTFFHVTQVINLTAKINVAPEHVGRSALLFAVANFNNNWFMKTPKGWLPWNFKTDSLQAIGNAKSLAAQETLELEKKLTGLTGKFTLYLGYQADNDIHYNATPFTFTVSDQAATPETLNGEILPSNIVLNQQQTQLIKEVTPNSDGSLSFAINSNTAPQVPVGQVINIPANDSLGLPLGFAGKVVETTNADGQPSVKLVPAQVEDVFSKLKIDMDSVRDNTEIVDVIAPRNAKVTFKKLDSNLLPKATYSGCPSPKGLQASGSLGCKNGKIEGKLIVEYEVKVKKRGSPEIVPAVFFAEASLSDGQVNLVGEFDAEKYLSTQGWARMSAKVNAKMSVKAGVRSKENLIEVPSLTELIRADKNNIWDNRSFKYGETLEISGLKGDDKDGLIPLGGLVIAPVGTKPFTGNLSAHQLGFYQSGAFILWLYLDLSGNITMQGEVNLLEANDLSISRGFDIKLTGPILQDVYDKSKDLTKLPTTKVSTNFSGSVEGRQNLGVMAAVDFFVSGIRPASLRIRPLNANLTLTLSGEGGKQWYPAMPGLYGSLCMNSTYSIFADARFNAFIKAKMDIMGWKTSGDASYQFDVSESFVSGQFDKPTCQSSVPLTFSATSGEQDSGRAGYRRVNIDLQTSYTSKALQAIASDWELLDSYSENGNQTAIIALTDLLKSSNPAGKIQVSLKAGAMHTLRVQTRKKKDLLDYGITAVSNTQVLDVPGLGCEANQVLQNGVCVISSTQDGPETNVISPGGNTTIPVTVPTVPSQNTQTTNGNSNGASTSVPNGSLD